MSFQNRTKDSVNGDKNHTCTGFDPRKIYMLGEKDSGLKPRGALQNYDHLKKNCMKNNELFEDQQFSPENIEMGDNCRSLNSDKIKWLRPKDIVKNPKFIRGGIDRFDVKQGDLGDCWFLAAIADVAQNHKLIDLIVPPGQSFYQDYAGIFHFRFWQYGRWIDIVIDDRLPTYGGKLIYLKSKDQNEFWTPLLEKAYAKLYGSYKNIEGGYTSEALQDLTGGLTEIYEELLELNNRFNFFEMMAVLYTKRSFMGCGITNSHTIEGKRSDGLYTRHAYSITRVAQITDRDERNIYRLIRIRNPWGECEWKGDWSDNSPTWELIAEDIKHHLLRVKDDGEFWMEFEDFITRYTLLEICHPNPDLLAAAQEEIQHWKSFMVDGSWIAKVTCGGLPKSKDFYKNPQYVLNIKGPEKNKDYRIPIGLMQKNRRVHNIPELSIGFVIYILNTSFPGEGKLPAQFFESRKPIYSRRLEKTKQVTGHVRLPSGRYCIVPFTEDTKSNCEFLLRVYSEVDFTVTENDEDVGMASRKNVDTENADVAIKELYRTFSGKDEEISWIELKKILDMIFKAEKKQISKEVCRSMVAMMDTDRSGKLNFHEFFHLWEKIGIWRGIFRNHDLDQSGTISASELRDALKEDDIRISNRILNMLILRYGNEQGELEMEDFLHCCIKLVSMIEIFELKNSSTEKLEKWILDTIYF